MAASLRRHGAGKGATTAFLLSTPQTGVDSIAVTYAPDSKRLHLTSAAPSGIDGAYREARPGELLPLSPGREPLVVMWVDEDFETAAIGTPSGRFGALLDRDGIVPEDRFDAARDVFEFNGWETEALRRTGS